MKLLSIYALFFYSVFFFLFGMKKNYAQNLEWKNLPIASIFQPVFKNDSTASKQIHLSKEEIKADVFPGYVAYRIELLFINTTDKAILLDVGFPLCNADSAGANNCRNFYWARLSVSGSLSTAPQLIYSGDSNHEKFTTAQNQELNWQKWNMESKPLVCS
jgi:hypothetical protein